MIESLLAPPLDTLGDESVDVVALLAKLNASPGRMPFDDLGMAFVAQMSRSLLTDKAFRSHPELIAMAHWFRAANLPRLREQLLDGDNTASTSVFLRKGLVFHIAPSNVDSVFIYSWLLSLLCGNANIARVSRRRTVQMQAFFEHVRRILSSPEFAELAQSNWVLSYDHDPEITAKLSAACHLRVIWGGDATISLIRQTPLPALSMELAFANRFSMALIKSDAVHVLDETGLRDLVSRFYNDVFWFNQRACSSPKAVWWIGETKSVAAARSRFWPALQQQINQQKPENEPAQVMNRLTNSFALAQAHEGARMESPMGELPCRILIQDLNESDRILHDGQGMFIELIRPSLLSMLPALRSRDQTLAHFGFSQDDWRSIFRNLPPHAADRMVPIGEALAFSSVWDGVNLLRAFTREAQLRIN